MHNQYPATVVKLRWAIDLAIEMHLAGRAPSSILLALLDRGVGAVEAIVVGREGFGLTIPEGKQIGAWWSHAGPTDLGAIDEFLRPILAENRRGISGAGAE